MEGKQIEDKWKGQVRNSKWSIKHVNWSPRSKTEAKTKTSRNNGQNFPKLDENTSLHTEVQLIPRRINTKKTKPKYIIIQVFKFKHQEKILKVVTRKKEHKTIYTEKQR